jgi:membrane protein
MSVAAWRRLLGARLENKLGMMPSFAAAMAFYFLVSLVPFLVVFTKAVAWLFSANLTPDVVAVLRQILPPESQLRPDAIVESVSAGSGMGLGPTSTLAAIWTGTSGLNEMGRAVHYVFSDPERPHTGGWRRWCKSFVLLAVWVMAIVAAALFLVLLPLVQSELSRLGAERLSRLLGEGLYYPAASLTIFAAFWLTFVFVPERRVSRFAALTGALLATLWWTGTCALFAYVLPRVWRVSLFHGALSSALAILGWAYCAAWGVLLGASWAARADERLGGLGLSRAS